MSGISPGELSDNLTHNVTPSGPPTPAEQALLDFAQRYPATHVDLPWGHHAVKVGGKKAFLFLSKGGARLTGSVKLGVTAAEALQLPFTEPTGYGLGRHGWVSFDVPLDDVPFGLLEEWVDESYRTVALKRYVKQLPPEGPPPVTSGS